jgi:CRP/FNR family transcriptional regulator, cyclic AMP receptor protein
VSSRASDIAAFLKTVRVFGEIADADLAELALRLREHPVKKGQLLFREGDAGTEMFIIRRGTMIVSKPVRGNVEQVLARLGIGDFFGEMSLFDQSPRSATLQAETDAVLLTLDRDSVEHLVRVSPRAAAAFFRSLVHVFIERLRDTGNLVAEVTRWGLEATGLDIEAR